jgi:hypothetical protein
VPTNAEVSGSEILIMSFGQLTDHMIATTNDDYGTSARLMIECLQLIPFYLPLVGQTGTEVARRYWTLHSASASDLERARVECWNYLDERSASTNTDEPEYCALRAVICVLYAKPPSDDIGELIEFFNQMLRGALIQKSDEDFLAAVVSVVDGFPRKVEAENETGLIW